MNYPYSIMYYSEKCGVMLFYNPVKIKEAKSEMDEETRVPEENYQLSETN